MKTVRLLLGLMVLALVGCGGSGGGSSGAENDVAPVESLDQVDLSGTWQVLVETKNFNKTSGDYLYSDFSTNRLILEDTTAGVRFRRCIDDFNVYSPYGVKSGSKLYLALYEDGYSYSGNNRFERVGPMEEYSWEPVKQLHQTRVVITKLSDDVKDDAGYLEFTEPFALDEQTRVCVEEHYSSIGHGRSVEIGARHGDYRLSISLESNTAWPTGAHAWERYSEDNIDITDVWLDASTELLESTIGFGNTYSRSGIITLSESSDRALSGSFNLIDENDVVFEGNFSWDKRW